MALVKLYKGVLRVSDKAIAENINIKAVDLRDILVKYMSDFREFGNLAFDIVNIPKDDSLLKIYYLNEQQATLLLTHLKNSKEVRKFKIVLIKSFNKVKKKLKSKDNLFKNSASINELSKALEREIEKNIQLTTKYKSTRKELLGALDKNYEAKELRKMAKKELLTIGYEFNQLESKLNFLAKTLENTAIKILKI